MIKKALKQFKHHLQNIPGWRTNRKIVVIESDDWGSIRMASEAAYNRLLKKGHPVDKCPYNRNDSLENNEDLEALFEVLDSVRDKNGNPAILTLNNIVANPDFQKIKESNFQEYFYEPFTETLKRYFGRDKVVQIYKEGIRAHLVYPQLHGREHLNINRWMNALNSREKSFIDAFRENMFTVARGNNSGGRRDYLDAFGKAYKKKWVSEDEVIKSGSTLFNDIWGIKSKSFISSCYIWDHDIEKILKKVNVKYLQGTRVQRIPVSGLSLKIKKKYHYLGQENSIGQRYLVRNVFFEPTEFGRSGVVEDALGQIKMAFKYKKPAIISSHRLNYIGSIVESNRTLNLKLLKDLLQRLVKYYPDVEFISSDKLGQLIEI